MRSLIHVVRAFGAVVSLVCVLSSKRTLWELLMLFTESTKQPDAVADLMARVKYQIYIRNETVAILKVPFLRCETQPGVEIELIKSHRDAHVGNLGEQQ